jgi:GDP-L-fucose synthase
MNKSDRIFVAGHKGLVGSAMTRHLAASGYANLLVADRTQVDLSDRSSVDRLFASERPHHVILAAARVGGIQANNSFPAEFIYENLVLQTNVIDSAYRHGVKKLLFLGSSCIYPKLAPQPIPECSLLTGPLEPTNEWYAIAKIAGIKLCQAYRRQYGFDAISAMPTNLYGSGDNFDLNSSHVLPALIRKFHEAKKRGDSSVVVWGSGTPRREFLYVDDLAEALIFLMNHYASEELVNVGVGNDVTIRELAQLVGRIVGFDGDIQLDHTKPDGSPRKLLDVSRLSALGWTAKTTLQQGITATYQWYLSNVDGGGGQTG